MESIIMLRIKERECSERILWENIFVREHFGSYPEEVSLER